MNFPGLKDREGEIINKIMAFEPKDIEIAQEFAMKARFKAQLDPRDRKSVQFIMEPEIPADMKPKVFDVIKSCADYFQRAIFLEEYEHREKDGPMPEFDNVIAEINYKLDYFIEEFVFEVKHATEAEKITISPFAKEMLKFRKMQNKQKADRLKKEQGKRMTDLKTDQQKY